jgi:hypothetical protein
LLILPVVEELKLVSGPVAASDDVRSVDRIELVYPLVFEAVTVVIFRVVVVVEKIVVGVKAVLILVEVVIFAVLVVVKGAIHFTAAVVGISGGLTGTNMYNPNQSIKEKLRMLKMV